MKNFYKKTSVMLFVLFFSIVSSVQISGSAKQEECCPSTIKSSIVNHEGSEHKPAQSKIYVYKCMRCGFLQLFTMMQINLRCPNDGWAMMLQM